MVEALAHGAAIFGRKVDRQALGSELIADFAHQRLEIHFVGIDSIDDDHPAKPALASAAHQTASRHLDAIDGVDDNRRGFDRAHRCQGLAAKVRISGGIDQLHFGRAGRQVQDGRIQRVFVLLFQRIEVGGGVAALDRAGIALDPGLDQQTLRQQRLATATVSEQGEVADQTGFPIRHDESPLSSRKTHPNPVLVRPEGRCNPGRFRKGSASLVQNESRLSTQPKEKPDESQASSDSGRNFVRRLGDGSIRRSTSRLRPRGRCRTDPRDRARPGRT